MIVFRAAEIVTRAKLAAMTEIILGVTMFTGIVLALVVVILIAKSRLVAGGTVEILVNNQKDLSAWAWANCTDSSVLCAVSLGVAWSTVGVAFPVKGVSAIFLPRLFLCPRRRYRPGYSKSPAFERFPGNLQFHGPHYRPGPAGPASPIWGIRAKFPGFCRSSRAPRFSAVFRGFSPLWVFPLDTYPRLSWGADFRLT